MLAGSPAALCLKAHVYLAWSLWLSPWSRTSLNGVLQTPLFLFDSPCVREKQGQSGPAVGHQMWEVLPATRAP